MTFRKIQAHIFISTLKYTFIVRYASSLTESYINYGYKYFDCGLERTLFTHIKCVEIT